MVFFGNSWSDYLTKPSRGLRLDAKNDHKICGLCVTSYTKESNLLQGEIILEGKNIGAAHSVTSTPIPDGFVATAMRLAS